MAIRLLIRVQQQGQSIILLPAQQTMSEPKQSSSDPNQQLKKFMSQITFLAEHLVQFTDGMELKIDNILKAQQDEFVGAYMQHMVKLKEEFKALQLKLQSRDEQILQYENQGKMSSLIKRVDFLQSEEKKLLANLSKRDQFIKELQSERSMLKSDIKRLQQKVKSLIRTNVKAEEQLDPTFSTEVPSNKRRNRMESIATQQGSMKIVKTKMSLYHQKSHNSEFSMNPQFSSPQACKLQKQVKHLRKQNRQLLCFNTKLMQDSSSMQNFFIETVNEIKKNVAVRRQAKQCQLQDFRKQDKLELLIKILSNDDILIHLHEKLFGHKIIASNQPVSDLNLNSSKRKIQQLRMGRQRFPLINSSRVH